LLIRGGQLSRHSGGPRITSGAGAGIQIFLSSPPTHTDSHRQHGIGSSQNGYGAHKSKGGQLAFLLCFLVPRLPVQGHWDHRSAVF